MKVYVEGCWGGGDKYSFHLTTTCGKRYRVSCSDGWWDRKIAAKALDLLQIELGIKRSNIRFVHH